jgi:hypothetical protein
MNQPNYDFCSYILLMASLLYIGLFFIFNLLIYKYKSNITQSLITISISLFILSYIVKNSLLQKELDSWLYYFTYILAIPLVYHLIYLMFFSYDVLTRMKIIKIYILFAIMIYLTLVWYNTRNLLYSNIIDYNNTIKYIFKLLTLF